MSADSPATLPYARPADERYAAFFDTDHLRQHLKARSVKGGVLTFTGQGGVFLFQFGSTLALARLLLPADFGLITKVLPLTGFVMLFKDLGLTMATIQQPKITHSEVSNLFWLNALIGLLLAGLTAAVAPLAAWFYADARVVGIMLGLAVAFVFVGCCVQHQAIIKRQMRFRALVTAQVVAAAFSAISAVVAAWLGAGYWALVVLPVTREVTLMALMWLNCRWVPGAFRREVPVGQHLKFGGNILGYNVVGYAGQNVDKVLLGRLVVDAALGYYALAYKMLMLPCQQLLPPLSNVVIPALSRAADDTRRFSAALITIFRQTAALAAVVVIVLVSNADVLVTTILGPEWRPVIPLFVVMSFTLFSAPISSTLTWQFIALGKGTTLRHWGVINTVILSGAVLLAGLLAPLEHKPLAVAASYSVSGLLLRVPLLYVFVWRYGVSPVRPLISTLVQFLAICVGGTLLLWQFGLLLAEWPAVLRLVVVALAALASYPLLLVALPAGRTALREAWGLGQLVLRRDRSAADAVTAAASGKLPEGEKAP